MTIFQNVVYLSNPTIGWSTLNSTKYWIKLIPQTTQIYYSNYFSWVCFSLLQWVLGLQLSKAPKFRSDLISSTHNICDGASHTMVNLFPSSFVIWNSLVCVEVIRSHFSTKGIVVIFEWWSGFYSYLLMILFSKYVFVSRCLAGPQSVENTNYCNKDMVFIQ